MIYVLLIWAHFVGDFLLQSNTMAQKKSENLFWLLFHVAIYTDIMLIFGWKFAIINGFLHFLIDAVTSNINKKLWNKSMHWFFVSLGFDQALHISLLIIIYNMLQS